ncbi:hypothetical protein [Rhizobium leguminosarum]|uniref:hypothetical protein n=1 Tax=Rhizobium leguminosarum TaxID=384 RepID=UPI001C945096|nr:hypothetical protein [Rhizobium leguminosarum]MBY5329573.1 hypothetical protein [Rhizobium leguminosarum]
MDVFYFEDWSPQELRKERRDIERQLLTAANTVSYSAAGGGTTSFISQAEAKALVRLLTARIAELEGRPSKRTGMRFITLIGE